MLNERVDGLLLSGVCVRNEIEEFISLLKQSPPVKGIFNPWRDVDRENDRDSRAPEIRTDQLRHYLLERLRKARYLLIAEAVGYQGGHFSGIPMTSERILLGYKNKEGILPQHVLAGLEPQRTSKPEIIPKGFSEPTATIVWGTLLRLGLEPTDFVLWNAFPWHPYDPQRGLLSNRRPRVEELKYGLPVLEKFLQIFHGGRIVALGKISAGIFTDMGIACHEVRHPANGGAGAFRTKIALLLSTGLER